MTDIVFLQCRLRLLQHMPEPEGRDDSETYLNRPCVVPPLPAQQGQAGQGNLTRNSVHRRSLNRLFSRNTSDNSGDKQGNKVDTSSSPS